MLSNREIQLAEKDLLIEIVAFLDSQNLRYSIFAGTLLGAIRHEGFIPWDDDIDLAMPRPDYDRLIKLAKKNGGIISRTCQLHAIELGNTNQPFIKIYNPTIYAKDDNYQDAYEKYLWVDIFPIDGLPKDPKRCRKIFRKRDFYKKLLEQSKISSHAIKNTKNPLKKIAKISARTIARLFPSDFWSKKIMNLTKKYPYETSERAGNIVWGYGPEENLPKSIYENYEKVRFEGLNLNGLSEYDEYLTSIYGDYMTLPPKEKRRTHNLKVWRRDEKV